jgi:hypothetical protein
MISTTFNISKKIFTSPSKKIKKLKLPYPLVKSTNKSNPSPISHLSDASKKKEDPDTQKISKNSPKASKATHNDGCPNGNARATKRKAKKVEVKPKAWPQLASNKPKTFSQPTPVPVPSKSLKTPPKRESDQSKKQSDHQESDHKENDQFVVKFNH